MATADARALIYEQEELAPERLRPKSRAGAADPVVNNQAGD